MIRRPMRALPLLTLAWALAGCTGGVAAQASIVDQQSGAGVTGSGKFDVTGSWDLKLTYDCTRQLAENVPGATGGVHLTVYNADDQSEAFEHPETQFKAGRANQVLHFQRPGPYALAIDSKCDWHLVIVGTGNNS